MIVTTLRIISLTAILLSAVASPKAQLSGRAITFRTQTMGTWGSLTIVSSDSAATAPLAYQSLQALHHVDSLMSNWTSTSEIARINREARHGPIPIHPEVVDVLEVAYDVAVRSHGAFDITVEPLVRLWGFLGGTPRVPDQIEIDAILGRIGHDQTHFDPTAGTIAFARDDIRIDLGGVAKGYAVDLAAQLLRQAGAVNALVDLSGNMVALGDAVSHKGWTVGVRDPRGILDYVARVTIRNEAIATSGDYEQFVAKNDQRYGHILDPRTGWSATGLGSVTVICADAIRADAWATALFVLGPEGGPSLARSDDQIAAVFVQLVENGKDIIWVEEILREQVTLDDQSRATHEVRYF
jgi:thiamine biosynthesis lipoprotein